MNDQQHRNMFQQTARDDFEFIMRHPAFGEAVAGSRDHDAAAATVFFSQALGYCRIWGVDLGKRDGSLPKQLISFAIATLTEKVRDGEFQLEQYERNMELASTGDEAELYSAAVLQERMDAWAAYIAVDERYEMLLTDNDDLELMETTWSQIAALVDALHEWDRELQSRADLLVAANDTHLIENWREALTGEFAEISPWWLDERFWQAAADVPLPDYTLWASRKKSRCAETSSARPAAFWKTMPTRRSIGPPLAVAAAPEEAAPVEYEFLSRSPQSERPPAKAIVSVPARYDAQKRLVIDVEFLYAEREPDLIRTGVMAGLGMGIVSPILVRVVQDGSPTCRYYCRFVLTAKQVERLQLDRGFRFRTADRYWHPMVVEEDA